jgi:thioredoxin 1
MMSEIYLNSSSFHKKINESDLPVMIDFYADWCGPCKIMSPVIEELAKEYQGKINVYKFNIDDDREIAAELGISSIPTVIFFRDGKQIGKFVGALPKNNIEEYLKKYA